MIQAVKCFLTKPIGLDLGIDPQRRRERRGAWQLVWPFTEAAEFGAGWGVRDLVSPPLAECDTEDKAVACLGVFSWLGAEWALGPKSSDPELVLVPPSPASLFLSARE